MNITLGAKIHIWCEGTKTIMKISNPNNIDPFGFTESLTILSDSSNGMSCNLEIDVE